MENERGTDGWER